MVNKGGYGPVEMVLLTYSDALRAVELAARLVAHGTIINDMIARARCGI